MADITTFLGLEKPIGGEKYSRAMINRNSDRLELDALARYDGRVIIDETVGTINDANVSTTSCKFMRIRVGNKGIVVAHVIVQLKTAKVLPANTASNLTIVTGFMPDGYKASNTIGNMPGTLSGSGRGDSIQWALDGTGSELTMRSAGAGFTTTAGVFLIQSISYIWNGVL